MPRTHTYARTPDFFVFGYFNKSHLGIHLKHICINGSWKWTQRAHLTLAFSLPPSLPRNLSNSFHLCLVFFKFCRFIWFATFPRQRTNQRVIIDILRHFSLRKNSQNTVTIVVFRQKKKLLIIFVISLSLFLV